MGVVVGEKKLCVHKITFFLEMGKSKKEIKFLVLGPAKSGKTTFIKQLEVPHNYRHGISSFQYLEKYRPYIYKNIFKAIQTLVQGMEKFQIEYESPESRQRARSVSAIKIENVTTFDMVFLGEDIKELCNDLGIAECYSRLGDNPSLTSAQYYFANIDRISMPDYVPNKQDIILDYTPTKTTIEHSFDMETILHNSSTGYGAKGWKIKLIDIGGIRSERRKWIHCFDKLMAVIFIADLSNYDESDHPIKNSHIKDYIPNYDGPQRDVKAAKIFIKNQFQDIYNCRHKPDYKGSLFDFTENDIRFLEKCKKSNKCHRTDSHMNFILILLASQ